MRERELTNKSIATSALSPPFARLYAWSPITAHFNEGVLKLRGLHVLKDRLYAHDAQRRK